MSKMRLSSNIQYTNSLKDTYSFKAHHYFFFITAQLFKKRCHRFAKQYPKEKLAKGIAQFRFSAKHEI